MNTTEELARRLTAGLEQVSARDMLLTTPEEANALAGTAAHLQEQLTSLPTETRQLLHTADSGFAASGKWVDDAIEAQTGQVKKFARASGMVAAWLGPDGAALERTFVVRGHIRGWAHRWRTEDRGAAQVNSDPAFVAFATECLLKAGITDADTVMIEKALGSDWRTAASDVV